MYAEYIYIFLDVSLAVMDFIVALVILSVWIKFYVLRCTQSNFVII